MLTSIMTPASRAEALTKMSDGEGLDILVIGGGVTGAGVALEAATRGLRVGIVEAQDWASGTSSRSTKLVHGGLRYLQMLDFHLVHEALTERDLLINQLAPHLVKPVAFLYPLEHRVWERAYVGAGVALYDTLATASGRRRALPFHRHLSRKGMLRKFPDLRHDAAVGALQYWDASVDDARLVLTLVRTAAAYGALAASRTQLVELTKDESGAVDGAVVVDLETGREHRIRARAVINSTGVWTEETESLSGDARRAAGAGLQGDPHRRAPRPDPRRGRPDPADREVGPVLHPVVEVLADRDHGHALDPGAPAPGGDLGGHRLRPHAREHRPGPATDPRRHHRDVGRSAAAAAARDEGRHLVGQDLPRAHDRLARPRA